jgi:ABC-type histidine transport system ATPase subunit
MADHNYVHFVTPDWDVITAAHLRGASDQKPTSALDPELIGEVLHVMEQLAHEGTTMIVVTHEMHFAREAADRVLFIEEGEIVEQGPPEQVLNEPSDDRTKQFLRRFLAAS